MKGVVEMTGLVWPTGTKKMIGVLEKTGMVEMIDVQVMTSGGAIGMADTSMGTAGEVEMTGVET